mgnify:CR=1 FL=1
MSITLTHPKHQYFPLEIHLRGFTKTPFRGLNLDWYAVLELNRNGGMRDICSKAPTNENRVDPASV